MCGALGATIARAGPMSPDAAQRAEAQAHYAQGAALYKSGRYHEAVEQFLTADGIAPSAALSFNAARAYEKLGDSARALEFYRDYLRRGPKSDLESKVRARVAELESILKARGVQQVTVLSEPDGAEVQVDGRVVGTTPWTGELAPGTHPVVLRKDGYTALQRDLELPADRALEVSVSLSSAPPVAGRSLAEGSGNSERSRGSSAFRPGPWVTIGLGGAALAGAGIFELLRHSAAEDARSMSQENFPEYEDRYDSANSRQTTARVLAGTGAVLLVAGGVWAFLDHRAQQRERTKAALACTPKSCFGSVKVAF